MAEVSGSSRLSVANWRRNEMIRRRVANATVTAWSRTSDQGRQVEFAVNAVLAGQRATIASTDAYISASAGFATGTTAQPAGIDPTKLIGRAGRNGRFLEDVYGRIASVGGSEGFERGLALLRQAIATDMQLSHRNGIHANASADRRVVGYKRQINPAPGGQTCGFCVAASTARYSKQALLPLHPMCRCSVIPIFSTDPVPASGPFDRDRLDEVYARAGSTSRAELGKVRFNFDDLPVGIDSDAIAALEPRVAMHPELGPYLTGGRHDSVFTLQ